MMKYFTVALLVYAIAGMVAVQARDTIVSRSASDCFVDCLFKCLSGSAYCFTKCEELCNAKDSGIVGQLAM